MVMIYFHFIFIFIFILISKIRIEITNKPKIEMYIYECKYECILETNVMFEGEQTKKKSGDAGVIEMYRKNYN